MVHNYMLLRRFWRVSFLSCESGDAAGSVVALSNGDEGSDTEDETGADAAVNGLAAADDVGEKGMMTVPARLFFP
jgi:hypothetical protein